MSMTVADDAIIEAENQVNFNWARTLPSHRAATHTMYALALHIEVIPHFRRPHMMVVWTGRGRAVPKIVRRRGSIVHREAVEKLPSGFGD